MLVSLRFRFLIVLHALLCISTAARSQQTPAASFTVSGTVVNSITGEPIRGALVQVVSGTPDAVLTDGEGRFEFDNLSTPQASVIAHKPGFLNEAEAGVELQQQVIAVQGANASAPVVVKLTPQAVIFGRVQDETGQAVADLPVKLIYVRVVEGRKRWEQRAVTSTDPEGGFRFADLMPGVYYVKAGPSPVPAAGAIHEDAYPASFYPGAPGIEGASQVRINAGDSVETDFSLKAEPVFKVSGFVAGLSAGQSVGLEVTDESGDMVSASSEMGPAAGSFQLHLTGGSYVIRIWMQGSDGVQKSAEQKVHVQADVTNLRMVPVASPAIPVVIRTDFVNKSSHVFQTSGRPFQAATVRLIPEGVALANHDEYAGTHFIPGQRPQLAFQNLRPGKYFLAVNPNGNWYVQSARWGSVDVLQEELEIPAGSTLPPLEIVLRDDGGKLEGQVQSDSAPSAGQVLLVPDRDRSRVRSAMVGPSGRFSFGNLPPDGYTILALDRATGLQYADPGALDAYLESGTHLAVTPNGQQEVSVNLTRVTKP